MAGLDAGADYVVRTNCSAHTTASSSHGKRGARLIFLSTSRVYAVEQQNALNYREEASRFELEPEQPFGRRLSEGSRSASRSTAPERSTERPRSRRSPNHRVRGRLRSENCRQSLWSHRRPVADGQSRPGGLHPLDAEPLLRPGAEVLGYGGQGKQGGLDLGRRRRATWSSTSSTHRTIGRASSATSAGAARSASRCEDDRAVPRADRKHGPDCGAIRVRERGMSRSTCPIATAIRAYRLAASGGPRQILEAIFLWIKEHERAVERALG